MRSIGRLQHHNIAALYDMGNDDGTAFIVMELVTGSDLKQRLVSGERFGVPAAVDIAVQLLAALEFAHRRQVIHRDVKPANVMLQTDGVVKLCDFGVARLADSDATRTQGMIVGSLRYASPEQISGQPIDARTDVFSTGVLLYELLTGELPFKGQSDVEVLHRVATQATPSPRALDRNIPVELDLAVMRALAKDPAERFASAAEFARALGASSATSPDARLMTPPAVGSPPVAKAGLRKRWVAAAAGCAAAVAAAFAWYAARPAHEVTPARAAAPAVVAVVAASATPASATPAAATTASATTASATTGSATPASAMPASPTPVPAAAPPVATRPVLAAPVKPSASAIAPARLAPGMRVPEGAWHGQLACGPIVPVAVGPGSAAFSTALSIEVKGSRIGWSRDTSLVHSTVAGTFDSQGRFDAKGEGSRNDRPEHWSERASGVFMPKTRRIEGRLQLLRSSDGSVARECTLVAEPGSPRVVAVAPAPAAAPARAPASAPAPATPTPTPTPTTAPAPVPQATASIAPPAVSVPEGGWIGQLACGASQSAGAASPEAKAFTTDISVQVAAARITLSRKTATLNETAVGNFDTGGRFRAEGSGSYTDLRARWAVRASGEFMPASMRIEGRLLLLRTSDGSVARECTLRARRP